MNTKAEDPFFLFIDLYEKGDILKALQLILKNPNETYDSIHSNEKVWRFLVNYVDACVFKTILEAREANNVLQAIFANDKRLKVISQSFLEILHDEEIFFNSYLKNRDLNLKETPELQKILDELPPDYLNSFNKRLLVEERWNHFKQDHSEWSALIKLPIDLSLLPWYPFAYNIPVNLQNLNSKGDIPLIFLEPYENVAYEALLKPFRDQDKIFVFETFAIFFHMLQFEDLLSIFNDAKSFFYILEIYPQNQFNSQHVSNKFKGKSFAPLLLNQDRALEEVMPLLTDVLGQCLSQSEEEFKNETTLWNWLYQITRRLLLRKQGDRYGQSRYIAHSIREGYQSWYDIHKGQLPLDVDLGPLPRDYLGETIDQLNQKRQVRPFNPHKRIKLAHVVPQIIDGGHAPTKLLRNLVLHIDRQWFDTTVVSTERIVNYSLEYPNPLFCSDSSIIRGARTIEFFKEIKVKVFIEETLMSYENTANHIAELINQLEIDIVIFHGPDEINELCSCLVNTPIRILFDHGTLPKHPCFDLVILSTDEAYKLYREEFRSMGMESCVLPFSVDLRQEWQEKPYLKSMLGLPDDSFVMTTISNHLETRLTGNMCHAIGEILKQNPKAIYAPIGHVENQEPFRSIFEQYGVNDRVFFLGQRANPSQFTRSMDLYLNEFPFGSGLGMLDAMAAGCPVVSMYEEHGPQQARYGATYFGLDWVIKSGKKEDYVELASRLIQDKELYRQWSEHAKEQYEKRVNIDQYMDDFEMILEKFIEYRQNQPPK